MSFDSPQYGEVSAGQPALAGERRAYLTALDAAVVARGGMSCGVVPRAGTPVLHVINAESPRRSVEVGCDFVDGAWRFVWAATGETIGPVDDATGVVDAIARSLGTHAGVIR
ncbi:hypothetical protein [Actinomadura hibisca]|uniref:hypothetical protein n=1 Tax=Actinomadura hibisca TaxID=68565 RepID=UPI0012F91C02|nr:hypothetical protein [Actinomadura hibisca]